MASREWKPIPGWEDRYLISNDGEVFGLFQNKILTPDTGPRGHQSVSLYRNYKRTHRYIHQLVLENFIGACPEGMEALHWDDNKLNNSLENLRWGTRSENLFDCVRNGKHHYAKRTHCSRGHEYTPENTRQRSRGRSVSRVCRECERIKNRAQKAAKKKAIA